MQKANILKYGALFSSALFLADTAMAVTDQSSSKGFLEDSTANLLLRNMYFNRDYRNGASNSYGSTPGSYRGEWAQGAFFNLTSGFTQGTVGFGVDVFGKGGIKLDSGGGRTGTIILPVGDDKKALDDYGSVNGLVKLKISQTQLGYGSFIAANPMMYTDQNRLVPQLANGWNFASTDIDSLSLQGARITSAEAGTGTTENIIRAAYGGRQVSRYQYGGGTYRFNKQLDLSLYAAEAEDNYKSFYFGGIFVLPLDTKQSLTFNLDSYKQQNTGRSLAGDIDNVATSLTAAYKYLGHTITVGGMVNTGDTPVEKIAFSDGKATGLALPVSMQTEEFQGPRQRVALLKYTLDMAMYGVPGLSFMHWYQTGTTNGSHADPTGDYARKYGSSEGRQWERDLEARYVIQSGPAKNLSIRVKQAVLRGNSQAVTTKDSNEIKITIDYPIKLL